MSERFGASAVIPVRDGLPDVLEAVESALAQTLPPAEVIVVDDHSSDGTGATLERRFGARVRVLRGRFDGAGAARNAGWREARTPWVAFLDADDLWFESKLATAAQRLEASPEAGWFFSDGAFRTLDGELRPSWLATYADLEEPYVGHPVAELIAVNFVLTSSVVVRRDALEAVGGFDPGLSHAEDLDLWIRLARRFPATASRASLVRYQHREGGLTRQLEPRLMGDVTLFARLASDPTLERGLRRRARRRVAMAYFKLALASLREDRRVEARQQLAKAWLFPERALAVTAAWAASLLPRHWLAGLGRQRIAGGGLAVPMVRDDRILLRATPRARSAGRQP